MMVSTSPIKSDNLSDENLTTTSTGPSTTGIVVKVAFTMARGEMVLEGGEEVKSTHLVCPHTHPMSTVTAWRWLSPSSKNLPLFKT